MSMTSLPFPAGWMKGDDIREFAREADQMIAETQRVLRLPSKAHRPTRAGFTPTMAPRFTPPTASVPQPVQQDPRVQRMGFAPVRTFTGPIK